MLHERYYYLGVIFVQGLLIVGLVLLVAYLLASAGCFLQGIKYSTGRSGLVSLWPLPNSKYGNCGKLNITYNRQMNFHILQFQLNPLIKILSSMVST